MKKVIYLIIIIALIVPPLFASADGVVIRPLPDGDWSWVDENSQRAFINYEQGTEKLIIAVDIEEGNSDVVWIIPLPSKPEEIEIDIISELPLFVGDDVISKTKLKFSEGLRASHYAALLGQVWTIPLLMSFVSLGGARSGGMIDDMPAGDSVLIESHIEKSGMIAEVITAKDGRAIYEYFYNKGFDIKEGNIAELDFYTERDYSFVVSWITPEAINDGGRGERGIFMSFPTPKIYYPLILTSAYGELEIPIEIRVLGHVRPEIFSEIKSHTEVRYFTNRSHDGHRAGCFVVIAQLRSIMEVYYSTHDGYPFSLGALKDDKILGEDAKRLLEEINIYCYSGPLYRSENKDDYTITVMITKEYLSIIDSFGRFDSKDGASLGELVSPELEKFYGSKKPWMGEADYTRIIINAPSNLLKSDLWMEGGRPLKISLALWIANNPIIIFVFLYLLIVGFISFVAGGIAGFLCFRKFKKYAIVGLSNIFTLLGLILIFKRVRKKQGEDSKYFRMRFELLFSIIFIFLLIILGGVLFTLSLLKW